jgi:hypothetical protein
MSEQPDDNVEGLDLALGRQIDAVCRRFEADFRDGRQPRAEDYLVEISEEGRPALRSELSALERELRCSDATVARPEASRPAASEPRAASNPFTIAEATTIAPGPPPTTPMQVATPSLVHDVSTELPDDQPRSPREEPTALLLGQTASATLGTSEPTRIRYFGDYEIVREIARGGM